MTGPVTVDLMSERVLLAINDGKTIIWTELTKDDALGVIGEMLGCVRAILEGVSVAPGWAEFRRELEE